MRELWIYNANASGDLASISLAAGLISQFKASGISILVSCSNIVLRTPDFSKWTKKARLNLWKFELPDNDMKSMFVANARIRGSIHTARELISELNDPKSERDLDYYFPAPEAPKIIPIQDTSRHKKKVSQPDKKKRSFHAKKSQEHKIPLITAMIGCVVLSVGLTGSLFWGEISKNQSILNLIGSLSIFKERDQITYENSSSVLIHEEPIVPAEVSSHVEQNTSNENRVQLPTALKKETISSEREDPAERKVENSVALTTPKTINKEPREKDKQVNKETNLRVQGEASNSKNPLAIPEDRGRRITLPIVGGDHYLQAGAFSRRASADRWIRSQNGGENSELRKNKRILGGFVSPFSEFDAKRQQDLKRPRTRNTLF